MSLIGFATTPHPTEWLAHTPRPDMQGKRLGIVAHTWFTPARADQLEPIFRTITDIAVEEPTNLALDANVSLQDPLHNMMYEEWEDYDEFFATQLTRPYRMAFLRWLVPVMAAPISAEFFEVIGRSGSFASGDCTAVLSVSADAGTEADAARLTADYAKSICQDTACLGETAMRSLNDPAHFVCVERWTACEELGCNLADHPTREAFAVAINGLGQDHVMTAETFRVHHNPGRFSMPG